MYGFRVPCVFLGILHESYWFWAIEFRNFCGHTVDGRSPAKQLRLVVHPFIPSSFTKRFFTSQVVVFSPDFVTPSTVCQDAIKTTDLDTWSCGVFLLKKVNGFFQTTWQQDDPQETGRNITSNEPSWMIPPKHWTNPEQPNLKYVDIANVKKSNQNKHSEIMTHLLLSQKKSHPSS